MVNFESKIVENALRNLEAGTGIIGQWKPKNNSVGGETIITFGQTTVVLNTAVKSEFREYQLGKLLLQAECNKPFMLIADKIFPAQKQRLRESGIAYLDTSGNIYISTGSMLLWVDGQKSTHIDTEKKTNRAFTKAGLKVVYTFLQNPEAVNYSYREIAGFSKVSLGTINEAISALKEAGYLLSANKKRMILSNKRELLDNWIVGYKNILKPSLLLGTYYFGTNNEWKQLELPETAVWGGEPAGELETNHLNPEQWTIYTAQAKLELVKTLRLAPRADGNLKVYDKFWIDKTTIYNKNPVTPELITYADLMLTGDARCIETAQIIYERSLTKLIDLP